MPKREWSVPDDRVNITHIIRNKDKIFSGSTLQPYLQALFASSGLRNPYHDGRHSMHVMRSCFLACRFHIEELTPLEIRHIVIAGLLHDLNHSGRAKPGFDFLEIPRAIFAFGKCVQDEDRESLSEINALIEATLYPLQETANLSLGKKIIRDADMTQTFGVAWVQKVAIGLAAEWDMTPLQILRSQKPFLSNLKWNTDWAKQTFTDEVIHARIIEAEEFAEDLEWKPN